MKILHIVLLGLVLSSAAAAEAPSIIKEGFDAYKEKGIAGGFDIWLRGSALQGDTTTRLNVLGGMTQIESAYGKLESYEVIRVVTVSTRLVRVYTVSYYTKGPVFSYFDLYKTEKDWVVYMLMFNTKPQEILPREALAKTG